MKLSEAIRLGALLNKQKRYLAGDRSKGTCALEAATEALGFNYQVDNYFAVCQQEFRLEFMLRYVRCPECHEPSQLEYVITFCLNDRHGWTREHIADWVETIEPHEESPCVDIIKKENPMTTHVEKYQSITTLQEVL